MRLKPLLVLLVRLALFLAPLGLGLAYLEWRLPPRQGYAAKRRLLVEIAPSAEIVIIGSSHAHRGIDPARLPCSAVNLANDWQTIDIDEALVRTHIIAWKRVRVPEFSPGRSII